VLGLLIAVSAFAIDMYIPGFAAIARDLRTDPGTVQLSMTGFFAALAVGQLVYGPMSDALGRKRPIYYGLALFVVASVAAAFAPSAGWLIAGRVLQGLGAAAAAVVPMAVIRDLHSGPEAARLMSLAMLALSVSPILAPSVGGVLVQFASWRLIFLALAVIGGLAALMARYLLPETLPRQRRTSFRPARTLADYVELLRDRRFTAPILIAGSGQAVLFVFISASPFVFVTLYRLPPVLYGALFALHAACLIGTSQANAMLMRRLGVRRLLGLFAVLLLAASLLLAVLVALGRVPLPLFAALTLTLFVSLGQILGPAFLTAMEPFGRKAGAAAAVGVASELTLSTLATFILGLSANGTAWPMAVLLLVASACVFGGWLLLLRTARPEAPDG